MIVINFINYIHVHSECSNVKYYDAINKIAHIPKKAKELGSTAVALTDHESMSGHPAFLEACQKENIKPILGNEIYLTRDDLNNSTHQKGEKFFHLILLAKNRKGWEVLNQLSSHAWGNAYTSFILRTPTYISYFQEVMRTVGKGNIIISSACLGGILGSDILSYLSTKDPFMYDNIVNKVKWLSSLVDEGDFYLEVQPALYEEQKAYNSFLLELGKALNVPVLIATDAHYLNKEDFLLHHTFLNSQRDNATVRETENFYKYTYFMPIDEIKSNLSQCSGFTDEVIEQCIMNTNAIAGKIEVYDLTSPQYLMESPERAEGWENWLELNIQKYKPLIPMVEQFYKSVEIDRYFIYELLYNLELKIEKKWINKIDRAYERLNEELDTIYQSSDKIQERLSKYFLTMKDMLNIIWQISLVGPGRGSAGSSLIAFLFDITALNPLEVYEDFELPFWRFLHPSRPELPDIDWDSSSVRKNEISLALQDWCEGFNHTIAKVATFGTLKSKQALQVAAGGLGYEPEDKLYFSSLVPIVRGFPTPLEECYKLPVFQQPLKEHPDVFEVAEKLEGLIVSQGQHAAAIVFFNKDDMFSRCSFIKRPKDELFTTAFDLNWLEKLGVAIKFDMLQTKAIDANQTTLMLLIEDGYIEWEGSLKATYDKYLHPSVVNHEDSRIWDAINEQKVIGLFQ